MVLFVQDMRTRAVTWIIFPAIFILNIIFQLSFIDAEQLVKQFTLNLFLISCQIAFLLFYLKITRRSWRTLTTKYFAWGDILFFIIIGLSFPVYFFLLFIILSIIISIIISLVLRFKTVPLAGFQALLFALILLFNVNINTYAI